MSFYKIDGLGYATYHHVSETDVRNAIAEVREFCEKFSWYNEQKEQWEWFVLPHAVEMLLSSEDWKDWCRYRIFGQ